MESPPAWMMKPRTAQIVAVFVILWLVLGYFAVSQARNWVENRPKPVFVSERTYDGSN